MRTSRTVLTFLGVAGAWSAWNSAFAGPPPMGAEQIIFNLPVIICDTRAQIEDVYSASQASLEKGFNTAFVKWYKVINADSQHSCDFMQVMFLHVYEDAKLGLVDTANNAMPAWAVHAGNDSTDAGVLYVEPNGVNEWRPHAGFAK